MTFQPFSPQPQPHAMPAAFAGYRPPAGYDEAIDGSGMPRPHWRALAEAIGHIPAAEQIALDTRLRRLVREAGIAQDVFAKPAQGDAPWSIDLIPLIISTADWAHLAAGVRQRAALTDLVLRDVYGPQTLLRSGAIPPALVFADPAFLRPCHSAAAPAHGQLTFYAADVARGRDGTWRVLDSHTETPAGLGFALANRIIGTSVVGDMFRRLRTAKLADFFARLQGELVARAGGGSPVIALLSPGPRHQDYFGHAYLARYLGFRLIEGGDSRIVDDRVYVKTLEGLKPIDLLVRCIEGAAADPLELSPGGYSGPVGLVQAARRNPDLVRNPLGAALAENRGLGTRLPALCEALLGEQLVLQDAPRLWLGDAASRETLFADPSRFIIRPAHEGTGRPGAAAAGVDPDVTTDEAQARFRRRIERSAGNCVAEEHAGFATMPSWAPGGLTPRSVAFRMFAACLDGEWQVMPGGIALDVGADRVSLHAPTGHSRDVWVMDDAEPTRETSRLRRALETQRITRGNRAIRSRIADNLFWLGRYAERADWTMRLLRGALQRQRDENRRDAADAVARALGTLLAKDTRTVTLGADDDAPRALETIIAAVLTSPKRSYGLRRTVENMQLTSTLIRDRLSVELWRTLQGLDIAPLTVEAAPPPDTEVLDLLDTGLTTIAAFNGLAAENMTRNHGWTFLDLGRRIERARNLADVLLALFGSTADDVSDAQAMLYILEVADVVLTYRSRYLAAPVFPLVLDLLMSDEGNPRSIAFQLAAASDHLGRLPQASKGGVSSDEERLTLDLLTRVRLANVGDLAGVEPSGVRENFRMLMTRLAEETPRISEAVTRRYFSLTDDDLHRVNSRPNPRG